MALWRKTAKVVGPTEHPPSTPSLIPCLSVDRGIQALGKTKEWHIIKTI